MGIHSSISQSINHEVIDSIPMSLPLAGYDSHNTQVHQFFSYSPDHHKTMLEKIRNKKKYTCQYVTKIIDSHTIQSQNMCSTVLKTYIVIEKPQSLSEEIEYRLQNSLGFQEKQIWTILYSCCQGTKFLLEEKVQINRLNSNKIFIDPNGCVKISDPEIVGIFINEEIAECEAQVLKDIHTLVSQIVKMSSSQVEDPQKLSQIVLMLKDPQMTLEKIIVWIEANYLKEDHQIEPVSNRASFGLTMKERCLSKERNKMKSMSKSKKKALTILSGKKNELRNLHSLRHHREKRSSITNSINSFQISDPETNKQNVIENLHLENLPDPSHFFPKKALFSQRKKRQSAKDPVKTIRLTLDSQSMSKSDKEVCESVASYKIKEKSKLKMVSYQVDQETEVCQFSSDQSQYLFELINNRLRTFE